MIRFYTIACLMMMVSDQVCAQTPSEEKTTKRHIRMLVMGERPFPAYKKQGELYIEVEPDLRLIPPTQMELDTPGKAAGDQPSKKEDRSIGFSLNQVFRLNAYKGPEAMGITLKNSHTGQDHPVKLVAHLEKFLQPLVIISADPSNDGWDRPRVMVVDISEEALPGGSGMVINHSKWPVRIGYGDLVKDQSTGVAKLVPEKKTPGAVAVKIEMKTRDQMITLFNNRHILAADERLLLFLDDTRNPVPNVPPVVIRFATDTVKVPTEENKKG